MTISDSKTKTYSYKNKLGRVVIGIRSTIPKKISQILEWLEQKWFLQNDAPIRNSNYVSYNNIIQI